MEKTFGMTCDRKCYQPWFKGCLNSYFPMKHCWVAQYWTGNSRNFLRWAQVSLKEVMLIHEVCLLGHRVLIYMSVAFANTILLSSSLQFQRTSLQVLSKSLDLACLNIFCSRSVLSSRKSPSNFFFSFSTPWARPQSCLHTSVVLFADNCSVNVQDLQNLVTVLAEERWASYHLKFRHLLSLR